MTLTQLLKYTATVIGVTIVFYFPKMIQSMPSDQPLSYTYYHTVNNQLCTFQRKNADQMQMTCK